MTEYEELLRQDAGRRGWTVEVEDNLISIVGVPYRKRSGAVGTCQISVGIQGDGLALRALENANRAAHAALLTGVDKGHAYQADGNPVGNMLWTDGTDQCVISIMRDDGDYDNAWHALTVYVSRVAGALGEEQRKQVEPIFRFEIEGEDDQAMQDWRARARGQRIGIVGLGGVGLWILDMMSKTDVREIRIWDGDDIEGRNLLRAPGWAGQEAIDNNKAEFYGTQYDQMRRGLSVCGQYWRSDDPVDSFDGLNFVFIAVDKTDVRSALCQKLEEAEIPFVDVGMGIQRRNGRVRGSCQVFFSGEDPGRWRIGIPTIEGVGEEEYRALQLADVGALNAALAVGMWRRHIGQYEEETKGWLVRYQIEGNDLLKKTES